MRLIFNLLMIVRRIIIRGGEYLFRKAIDPETGRVRNYPPQKLRMLLINIFITISTIIILSLVFKNDIKNLFIDQGPEQSHGMPPSEQ